MAVNFNIYKYQMTGKIPPILHTLDKNMHIKGYLKNNRLNMHATKKSSHNSLGTFMQICNGQMF